MMVVVVYCREHIVAPSVVSSRAPDFDSGPKAAAAAAVQDKGDLGLMAQRSSRSSICAGDRETAGMTGSMDSARRRISKDTPVPGERR